MTGPLVVLWSPPRCRSTAFARMMMERGDLTVVHEPFSNRAAEGTFTVGGRAAATDPELLGLLLDLAATGPVFVKETTDYRYPELLADPRLTREAVHSVLVRAPEEAIASHHAVNPAVTRDEIGFERCWEVFDVVRRATGRAPVVVDSADLVSSPAEVVAAYCARVGLPFLPHALEWRPGPRAEWARTAAWHRDAERTTGIQDRATAHAVTVADDPRLAAYDRYHRPFYERLREHRLTV